MSLPANLFIDTPEMEDVSLHQLGSDTESWPEEIIQKVKERLPRTDNMNFMVKFMKKDDENGVATGSVTVHSADKAAVIPIIIKDFMLFPIDVFFSSSKLLPLTPDYFDAAFARNQLFDKIEEYPTFGGLGRFEDANLWNAIYPPSLGRYAYASGETMDVLSSLSDTFDGAELKTFLHDPANEKIAARLLTGPYAEVIQKIANLRPVNMNEFQQGVENLIPRSIVMLRRGGPNKYTILSNSDKVFHPGVIQKDCTRYDAANYLSGICDHVEDDINDVDQNGEKFLVLPQPKNDVILAKEDQEIPESADEYDHYVVKTKTGVSVEGVVIPHVIDFDQKRVALKAFLGKTMSTVQPEIYGVRVKNSRFKPPMQMPQAGQTGVFVFQPDEKHAICTVPVTIRTVIDDMGQLCLNAHDLMGLPLKLEVQHQREGAGVLHRIVKTAPATYKIPGLMRWVPMEDFGEVTNSPDDYAVKQAGARITDWPVKLILTGFGQYAMRGVDKYAAAAGWDKGMLEPYQVKFLLASLGAGEEKIAMGFKHAYTYGVAEFHNLARLPLASEKVAAARPLATKMTKFAEGFRHNMLREISLIQSVPPISVHGMKKAANALFSPDLAWAKPKDYEKVASYLENSQTVDALLSLNFVNPTNIAKYVGKLPSLKAAISHLASCLIASRIGMKEIPELATSTAMSRLVEVVDGLEKLRATQEVAARA